MQSISTPLTSPEQDQGWRGAAETTPIAGPRGHLHLLPETATRASRGDLAGRRFGRPDAEGTFGAPIRVLIGDGHALMRAGYRALLERAEGIEVVGEAGDAHEAVALAAQTRPDVALLDEGLPGVDDLEAAWEIGSHPAFAAVAIVVMASNHSDDWVVDALLAGAVGVLRKDDPPDTLIEAVRRLARGEALLPTSVVRRLLGALRGRPMRRGATTGSIDELTEREREVVALAAEGLTNGEIASRLVISPATAKTHVTRAMAKLHARHRAELVVSAYENGLVLPRELASIA